ncbi:MAG: aminoglycoside 3-N-acetyltransferase [Inquilinus limosus]|uniref:Aminoglycoside N(3)-acetyltransferase n=1 Tax=Inquilinus limosus TaxID=171674 RepID=A0A952FHZ5_9PROT|nr:aminoglycoside 3-N-acetyltransferase [Inquilinus limosus]
MTAQIHTRRTLAAQIRDIGLGPDDAVMVHAGLRSAGRILGGPDVLIDALHDVIGPGGTILVYTDWSDDYHELLDDDGNVPAELRDDIPPFDPAASRARRANGAIAELVRTRPGARRSANPGASFAAVGGRAEWFTADHALDYGYGEQSPFARLVQAHGKVLMLGAPLDAMSLLHHAEHLARIPGKRVVRTEAPILVEGRTVWRRFEEFDTSDPIVDGLPEGYFATVVEDFLAAGRGVRGSIGDAASVLVPAAEMADFAVRWLEDRYGGPHQGSAPRR